MTVLFRLNLLFAVGWCAMWGRFSSSNLVWGFLIGFAALSVASPMFGPTGYFGTVVRMARLGLYFHIELLNSSLQVAWEVLTPVHRSSPAIVAIPLEIEDPLQIASLANLISLTPGTLSLDVSPDRRTLYVHCMFVDDPDEIRSRIKSGFERLVKEAME